MKAAESFIACDKWLWETKEAPSNYRHQTDQITSVWGDTVGRALENKDLGSFVRPWKPHLLSEYLTERLRWAQKHNRWTDWLESLEYGLTGQSIVRFTPEEITFEAKQLKGKALCYGLNCFFYQKTKNTSMRWHLVSERFSPKWNRVFLRFEIFLHYTHAEIKQLNKCYGAGCFLIDLFLPIFQILLNRNKTNIQ